MKSAISYKKFLENSQQAMLAAVEIYNKPKFNYREEVFVVLLINAWELFLLAVLSKEQKNIFRTDKKELTLQFDDLFRGASQFFGMTDEEKSFVKQNLERVKGYRNAVIHYGKDEAMPCAIYYLGQAAILNYVELVRHIFGVDFAEEINIALLPLSFNSPPNVIEFLGDLNAGGGAASASNPYMAKLSANLAQVENSNVDARLLFMQF